MNASPYTDGAREDIIERITHNATGTIVDQYTHFGWEALCEAVSCLRFDLKRAEIVPLKRVVKKNKDRGFRDAPCDAHRNSPMISDGGGGSRTLLPEP